MNQIEAALKFLLQLTPQTTKSDPADGLQADPSGLAPCWLAADATCRRPARASESLAGRGGSLTAPSRRLMTTQTPYP